MKQRFTTIGPYLVAGVLLILSPLVGRAAAKDGPVSMSGSVGGEDLGIAFKVGKPGSAAIKMTNSGNDTLKIGDHMLLYAEEGQKNNIALLVSPANTFADQKLSTLVYGYGATNVSQVAGGNVLFAFGPGGDWLQMQGMGKEYRGTWPTNLAAGGSAEIVHRLATWPGAERGWLASPLLTGKDGKSFRVIGRFGDGPQENRTVPMEKDACGKVLVDSNLPVPVRVWAASWLVTMPGGDWSVPAKLLADDKNDAELRKGMAKILATQAPAKALAQVAKVLENPVTPGELQLSCYYTLTWSKHPEARGYIEKAAKHAT